MAGGRGQDPQGAPARPRDDAEGPDRPPEGRVQDAREQAPVAAPDARLLVHLGLRVRRQSPQSDVGYRFSGLVRYRSRVFTPMAVLTAFRGTAARYEGCRKRTDARACR